MFKSEIIADSVAPHGGRIVTYLLTYPRFIHSEVLTHRQFSRNSASSRAIPIKKMRQVIIQDPVIPVWMGKAQKGMQANEELTGIWKKLALFFWLNGRFFACLLSWILEKIGLHKQIANRVLEPWMWMTVVLTSTKYSNFFALRYHPDAQPEFQHLAKMMWKSYLESKPEELKPGEWHTPFITKTEKSENASYIYLRVSTGRCARTSYETHLGFRDMVADVDMHNRLEKSGHWSPFEHCASPHEDPNHQSNNFHGFTQYRETLVKNNHEFFSKDGVTVYG